jgi:hypothetical protein
MGSYLVEGRTEYLQLKNLNTMLQNSRFRCITGNDLSNIPAKIQMFPLTFEFMKTIQIDQWERFPPKKNYRLILITNENWSYGKTEPMKTFDSSNQSEKNPALVFFNFKIYPFFNNSRSERDVLLTIPCIIGYLSSTF